MAVFTIPTKNYRPGTSDLGQVAIAGGMSNITIAVDRSNWTDPAVTLHARFEISLDGGVTWSSDPSGETVWPYGQFPVTFDAAGGVLIGPGGVTQTVSSVSMNLPDTANANRVLRGTATVAGGTLRASITITTT